MLPPPMLTTCVLVVATLRDASKRGLSLESIRLLLVVNVAPRSASH